MLVGLLLLKYAVPDRNMSPMLLTMDEYNKDVSSEIQNPISFNSPDSFFSCNPGRCSFNSQSIELANNESYSFCGGQALQDTASSCFISNSESVVTNIVENGVSIIGGDMANIAEVSLIVEQWPTSNVMYILRRIFAILQLVFCFVSLQRSSSSNLQMFLKRPSTEEYFSTTSQAVLRNLALSMQTSFRKAVSITARDTLEIPSANCMARALVTQSLITSQHFMQRYVSRLIDVFYPDFSYRC